MEYFIFQRWIDGKSKLYIMNQKNGIWSVPELLPFIDKYQVGDFTIAPDGKTLIFASNIPIDEIGSEGEGGNIWIVKKKKPGGPSLNILGCKLTQNIMKAILVLLQTIIYIFSAEDRVDMVIRIYIYRSILKVSFKLRLILVQNSIQNTMNGILIPPLMKVI